MSIGWRYFLRRVLVSIVLLWLLSVITFAIYFTIPQEPAAFLVDPQHATPAMIRQAHHRLGVDKPVTTQYAKFVWRALHGDFGLAFRASASARPISFRGRTWATRSSGRRR
jgi:peptide/nickel transport system permease protein